MQNVSHDLTEPEGVRAGTAPQVGGPSPADNIAPDLTGTRLGDFQLLRRLGQGGMGQVYLAEQISLKRKVAIKILRDDLAANETALQRFRREAEAVARATHANIVQVYFIGQENGLHFMALEYVEGKNLRDYLEKKGPPDVLVCIGILRQVAAALQRASELGIIHRDIKPENILITRKSEVKVADFGLSRVFSDDPQPLNLTQSGVTMGTPLYMSPEQVEGRPLDPRTDIYSLGVTAYHLLCGQPPFRGQTPFEVALQHVQKEPVSLAEVRPDLPPELCAVVHRMLAKKPEDRYQTAHDIVRDLSQLRDHLVGLSNTHLSAALAAQITPPPNTLARPSDSAATTMLRPVQVRRHFPWLPALAVLLMLGVGSALGLWWNQHHGRDLPDPVAKADTPDPDKQEEQDLLTQFAKFKEATLQADVRRGMDAGVDLLWFYLNRDLRKDPQEFRELTQFVNQLETIKQPHAYHYLGELGDAILLAMKNRAEESNSRFEESLPKINPAPSKPKKGKPDKGPGSNPESPPPPKSWIMVGGNPTFRKMLSLALERNHANLQRPLSAHLEFFRTVPHAVEAPKKING